MSDLLLTEVRDRVAYVVLNRPEKRNALSAALVQELYTAIEGFNNTAQIRVIVLKSADKPFVLGPTSDIWLNFAILPWKKMKPTLKH